MGADTLLSFLLNAGLLAPYTNKNLYRSAILLQPSERPTVPVEIYDNPDPIYKDIYQQLGQPQDKIDKLHVDKSEASGVVTPRHDVIYINRNNSAFKNPVRLASTLAHEQKHIENNPEGPAYDAGLTVLERNANRVDPAFLDVYRRLTTAHYEDDRKQRERAALRLAIFPWKF